MDAGTTRRGGICFGLVRPRHIFQGPRRTCVDALLAEIAFGRLSRRFVQGRHSPGTGLRADAAADAFVDIDHPGVDRRDDLDGAVGASQLAGHRVRALAAGILNDAVVALGAFPRRNP